MPLEVLPLFPLIPFAGPQSTVGPPEDPEDGEDPDVDEDPDDEDAAPPVPLGVQSPGDGGAGGACEPCTSPSLVVPD